MAFNNEYLSHGHVDAVRELIAAGAGVEARGDDGATPLMGAASHGRVDAVKELIKCNAKVNASDKSGRTALILAARGSYLEAVMWLLIHDADVQVTDGQNLTALDWAKISEKENAKHVVALLKRCQAKESAKQPQIIYEPGHKLGEGQFSDVYKGKFKAGTHEYIKDVAVKRIRKFHYKEVDQVLMLLNCEGQPCSQIFL